MSCLTTLQRYDDQEQQRRPHAMHLYGEKLSWEEGTPSNPSYFGRTNVSCTSLQKLVNHLKQKQKVPSARGLNHRVGHPFATVGSPS